MHDFSQLIFDTDDKNRSWIKESIFNKWYWRNWLSTRKRMKLVPYLSPCTKTNSEWIKDLSVKCKALKLLEENVGVSCYSILPIGKDFENLMTKEKDQQLTKRTS